MLSPDSQTVLVTGATDGIGRAVATRLAQLGATVIVHGRSESKLHEVCEEIHRRTGSRTVHPVQADLSSLTEVDALADEILGSFDRLHLLISNAGVGFGPAGGQREESADGIELRFAVNHLAAAHLARRLVPLLRASAPARIVQVASAGQAALDPDDLLTAGDWDGVTAYRRSKLAQTMAAFDLAEELRGSGVTVNALHPATLMDTTMVRDSGTDPRTTLEEGLTATVRLALDPTLDEVTGAFFEGTQQSSAPVHPQASDPEVREMLRRRSDELVAGGLAGERGGTARV